MRAVRRPGGGEPNPPHGLPALTLRGRVREHVGMCSSVLIVDDHARFRHAARRMLELEGWTVVGEAADGEAALDAARALAPDVVLLDVGLPDRSGLEVARLLHESDPQLAVVVVSTHDSADYRDLALASGALGFLAKGELTRAALEELLSTRG